MNVALRTRAGIAALALSVTATVAIPSAQAATSPSWRVSKVFTSQPLADLIGLTAPAADDVWAGGYGSGSTPTVVHWNGTTWTASTLPGATDRPDLLSSSASDNVWAAGGGGCQGSAAYVSRWNGTAWTTSDVGGSKFCASSVVTTAPDNGWLFGDSSTAEHYNGKTWKSVSLGNVGSVLTAWGVSASDVWALTYTQAGVMQAMNWNGKAWASTPLNMPTLPKGDHPYPLQVTANGAASVWGVIQLVNKNGEVTGPDTSYLLSWNGTGWQWTAVPYSEIGLNVASDGGSGAWVISDNPIRGTFYFLHYAGGQWTRTAVPTKGIPGTDVDEQMYALALLPGTQSLLASADVFYTPTGSTSSVQNAVIYQYGS